MPPSGNRPADDSQIEIRAGEDALEAHPQRDQLFHGAAGAQITEIEDRRPAERVKQGLYRLLGGFIIAGDEHVVRRPRLAGSTIRCALTLLSVLTNRTRGKARWMASPTGTSIGLSTA